jgi:hypothetical protein
MGVDRSTFASSTEVGVRTDSAFVPISGDPRTTRLVGAQGSIAVNSEMLDSTFGRQNQTRQWQQIVDGDKAMAVMVKWCRSNAIGAIIPVRATHALVPNTVYLLITAIAGSKVAEVPAWCTKFGRKRIKFGLLSCRNELVARVMPVLQTNVARNANIVVFAGHTVHKFLLGKNSYARVAGTSDTRTAFSS